MNLIKFLVNMFGSKEEILRCLDKSTIISFDGTNVLIADDEYIYYFGSLKPITKQFKKFYDRNSHVMIGKHIFSKDTNYMNRMHYLRDNNSTGQKVYVWIG